MEPAVHARHTIEGPVVGFDLFLEAVAELLNDRAFQVQRLLSQRYGQRIEHAGSGIGHGAFSYTQRETLPQVFELAVHDLDEDAGAPVGSLVCSSARSRVASHGGTVADRPRPLVSSAASSAQRPLVLVTRMRASLMLNVSE